MVWFVATMLLLSSSGKAQAEIKAELLESKAVWKHPAHPAATDLIRFRDRWYLAVQEASEADSYDGAIRILSSVDGEKWESVACIESPTPGRGISDPKLTAMPGGPLMVAATGIVPSPGPDDPLPRFGGTVQRLAWTSEAGRDWKGPVRIGAQNYLLDRVTWRDDVAYVYARGCICGNAQTVQINSSRDGKGPGPAQTFETEYERPMEHFPGDGAIVFDGDWAYCLVSRIGEYNNWEVGTVGRAKAPFTDWKWKTLKERISSPNLIRLPGPDGGAGPGTIVAVVRLANERPLTALCEVDAEGGILKPILTLPADARRGGVGLALEGDVLWVSYPGVSESRSSIHVAKIKWQRAP